MSLLFILPSSPGVGVGSGSPCSPHHSTERFISPSLNFLTTSPPLQLASSTVTRHRIAPLFEHNQILIMHDNVIVSLLLVVGVLQPVF